GDLLDFVIGAMFIALPSFWVVALGWTGLKLGSLMSGLRTATNKAEEAGGKGAGHAISVIKGEL
ncbi:hypothetical protein PSYMO_34741, partial [Pseudomonas amygdali pv. mori str. 301020]